MIRLMKGVFVLTAGLSLAACSEATSVDYDPNWGTDQFVPDGKADFIDLAPAIEYGGKAQGSVNSTQLDVYKLSVTNGDQFTVTMNVTSGDLAPDASLFRAGGGAIRSRDFSISGQKLTKDYVADGTSTLLIAARAFRNQGSGKYEISIECTGGPCNGDLLDPVDPIQDADISDIHDCLVDAFDCSFDELPSWGGRVGQTRAANIFKGCLAKTPMFDGTSCEQACDHDSDTQDLCNSIVSSLPFYADQSADCLQEVDNCMDTCMDGDNGGSDEIWETGLAMCWENGFNGTCNGYATQLTACGGTVQNDTAVCYATCYSSSGVWMDDLDTICEDECGTCGIQCGRELDWGVHIPSDGLVGDIVDTFMGEVDPFVIGDACITFVQVYQDGDGELPPGIYGLVEDLDTDCNADVHRVGEGVHATMAMLEEIADADKLDELNSAGTADRFFEISDRMTHVD